jgi:hypothetical protein
VRHCAAKLLIRLAVSLQATRYVERSNAGCTGAINASTPDANAVAFATLISGNNKDGNHDSDHDSNNITSNHKDHNSRDNAVNGCCCNNGNPRRRYVDDRHASNKYGCRCDDDCWRHSADSIRSRAGSVTVVVSGKDNNNRGKCTRACKQRVDECKCRVDERF